MRTVNGGYGYTKPYSDFASYEAAADAYQSDFAKHGCRIDEITGEFIHSRFQQHCLDEMARLWRTPEQREVSPSELDLW